MEASSKWVTPLLCSISYLCPSFPPFSFVSLVLCVMHLCQQQTHGKEAEKQREHFHVCG